MSSLDVERRLTEVLHRRAEVVMSRTDTQEELREFLTRGDPEPPRAFGRNRFTAAVAAGVAAAAAAAAVFWAADLTADRATEPAPVQQPAVDPARVADEYVAAYAAYDTDKVLSMADPQADLAGMRLYQARDEAFGIEFLMEPCRAGSIMSYGTQVTCPFSLHVMHSEELGRGPFENASFQVFVTGDGKVLESDTNWNYEINGMTEHWEEVTEWVWAQHPVQKKFLMLDEPDVPREQLDRWLRLWERYIQDYLEAHSRG